MEQANPFNWVEIYVQDMERARKFYEQVLGTKLKKLEGTGDLEMWAFPMEQGKPGSAGALVKMNGVSSGGGGVIVYFHTPDCATEAEKVKQAGGRIHKEKTSIGQHGFIALALDSEGNMFGLHSMK